MHCATRKEANSKKDVIRLEIRYLYVIGSEMAQREQNPDKGLTKATGVVLKRRRALNVIGTKPNSNDRKDGLT